ncbi:MAG TPA: hypothetical protein VGT61_05445 [Thermomicrobiales bacterium]|jgi:DNA polymerase III delta subunit|nr:hypothetical protein [Thermomicrobiales bacterium]
MIAIFCGMDGNSVRAAAAALVAERDPDGQSTSRLDGRTASISEIVNQVGAAGFFGGGRVVVVTDLLSRAKRGGKKADADADDDAPAVDVAPIFQATRPENLLVLVETMTASLPAAVRKAMPPDATHEQFDPPRGQVLVNWIQRKAREEGSSIEPNVARTLAQRLYPQSWQAAPTNTRYDRPPDMDLIANEVSKLVSAAWPDPVTIATIDEMAIEGDSDQIFRFGDAAAAGNLRTALPELLRLMDAGEEPARLSAQLAQQVELTTVIEQAGTRPAATIARDLGLGTPGRVNALQNQRRKGGRPARVAIAATLEADRATKRGRLRSPTDALYSTLGDLAPGNEREPVTG